MTIGVKAWKLRFEELVTLPFEQVPSEVKVRAFGMEYVHVPMEDGGDLYLTRYAWPNMRCLLPSRWYADRYYRQQGARLSGSTGHAYRLRTQPADGHSLDVVIKFSRVGQEVPLVVTTNLGEDFSPDEVANARFNSPMEEFGLLEEMRSGVFGSIGLRIRTQKPLGIFTPGEQLAQWKLGRIKSRFHSHQRLLLADQEHAERAMELDIKREYVMIYEWIKGYDAEQAYLDGRLTEEQLQALTYRAVEEMRDCGFRVLDTKPKHLIVRPHGESGLIERAGKVVYATIDYELLGRTLDWQRKYNASRRAKYLTILSRDRTEEAEARPLPPHLKRVNVLGVDYIWGTTPNGGRIWAAGHDPELFDFFLPDRWRRTPRVKLSLSGEVYRTRTRDNIHVVYRLSNVGMRPRGDPFYDHDKRIRQYGYNSPFEEAAIAQTLQRYGIQTAYLRAIYRTGHRSTRAVYLRDDRRAEMHADIRNPDGETALSTDHDYYTIWGYWRGLDPLRHYRQDRHWGFIDLEKAYEDRHFNEQEFRALLEQTRGRLRAVGFDAESVEPFEMLLLFSRDGELHRDREGRPEITISVDALTAHEFGLLSESSYREVGRRMKARMALCGCEALNMGGSHLLLSMNPDGQFLCDAKGHLLVTLGNMELVRLLRCPLNKPAS